jgi:DNA-directed RNA polymerase subunit M/transcription elongation factor TFIIS
MYHFNCPHCNTTLEHDEAISGETIQCGECHQEFVVGEMDKIENTEQAAPQKPSAIANQSSNRPLPSRAIACAALFGALCIAAIYLIQQAPQAQPLPSANTAMTQAALTSPPTQATNTPPTAKAATAARQDTQTTTNTVAPPPQTPPAATEKELEPDSAGNVTVSGLLKAKHIQGSSRIKYTLRGNAHQPTFKLSKSTLNDIDLNDFADQLVEVTGKVHQVLRNDNELIKITDITRVNALDREASAAYYATYDRTFDPTPNAKAFMGTWGPRVCIPSAQNPNQSNHFDATHLAKQLGQLDTAGYVMVNVTQPSGGCYFTGPHPELSKALQLQRPSFPTRDVLGIALDAIEASGKKALVYFGARGMHSNRVEEQTKAAWDQYIATLGLNHTQATRELLIQHYAKRYGTKIAGWWFDGSGHIEEPERILWRQTIHSHNPQAIMVFNRMSGPPYRSTRQCDIFGGHTTPVAVEPFWSMANEAMITDIERSPWMGITDSRPVEEGYGALGHAFMGMQNKWTMGKCKFPAKQAIDWTTRVLRSGGMFTWAVPLNQTVPQIPDSQFKLLKSINRAVRQLHTETKH